jgi:D-alanyl-D-alanine dipeptidase
MGTGYDCSDEKAHTASRAITPQQRKWRDTLVSAMTRQGFVNFRLEWWHFSLPGGANVAYDFPVTRRR